MVTAEAEGKGQIWQVGPTGYAFRLQMGSKDYTELGTEVGTKGKKVHVQDRRFTYRGSEGQSSLELYLYFSS